MKYCGKNVFFKYIVEEYILFFLVNFQTKILPYHFKLQKMCSESQKLQNLGHPTSDSISGDNSTSSDFQADSLHDPLDWFRDKNNQSESLD